jgi:hypothetical protein
VQQDDRIALADVHEGHLRAVQVHDVAGQDGLWQRDVWPDRFDVGHDSLAGDEGAGVTPDPWRRPDTTVPLR